MTLVTSRLNLTMNYKEKILCYYNILRHCVNALKRINVIIMKYSDI